MKKTSGAITMPATTAPPPWLANAMKVKSAISAANTMPITKMILMRLGVTNSLKLRSKILATNPFVFCGTAGSGADGGGEGDGGGGGVWLMPSIVAHRMSEEG